MIAKPRLLVLASTYPRYAGDHEPGFVHELCKRLVAWFEVIVLCPHADGAAPSEWMEGVEVIRYRYAPSGLETLVNDGGMVTNLKRSPWKALLLPGFLAGQLWAAHRLIRARQIQLVHAHWLLPQGLVAVLSRGARLPAIPVVVTSHGADLHALRGGTWAALKRFVLARTSMATVVSSAMLREIDALGMDPARVAVVPMGIDAALRFSPDFSQPRSSDEILFVGRLVEKKGVPHLLRAMPRILDTRPTAFLTIAGYGPDEADLRALTVALGIDHAVYFMGAVAQSQLPVLYRRAALFAAPYIQARSGDREGLPVALMEAIACGCPVLAGNVAGIGDMLGADLQDVAVDPRDEDRLADAVLRVLEDPAHAQARALRMGGDIRERFGWERISAEYARLLLGVLDG